MTRTNNINADINSYQQELIELTKQDLSTAILADQAWQQRYTKILTLGKRVQEKPLLRLAENEIKGCEAKLWLASNCENGQYFFCIDSDSRIIRGLAALLLLQLNGLTEDQINNFDAEQFLQTSGLNKHISPSRNNGLKLLLQQLPAGII